MATALRSASTTDRCVVWSDSGGHSNDEGDDTDARSGRMPARSEAAYSFEISLAIGIDGLNAGSPRWRARSAYARRMASTVRCVFSADPQPFAARS